MLSVRRPSLLNRALTTPPLTPTSPHLEPMPPKADTSTNLLTPPLSPRNSRSSSDLFGLDDMLTSTTTCSPEANRNNMDLDSQQDGALICPFDVEIIQNPRGRDQMFGSGAWSNVYKATPIRPRPNVNSVGLPTPPASPTVAMPIIVAVKQSARPDAKPILENEARILSFLGRLAPKRKPFVTFYGIIESSSSLVLEAIPLSLEDHLYCHAVSAKHSLTTSNISDPVVGSATLWLSLAQELVAALSWLHNVAEVVHGDIKPGNFLLQPRGNLDNNEFAFRPLFIDFSSSHRIDHSNNGIPAGTLSAVTREYTAPELLKSSVLRNPKSTATKASDVFSLAITLLVAATGNLMVYDGSVFQRQAMATQGWQAIGLARCGSNGSRVPRQGVVERTLDKAVLKHDMGRITASKWLELVEEMQKGEPTKEPREDGLYIF